MTENFLKFMSDNRSMIQEAQINAKKPTLRHVIFKLQKIKIEKKILKEARGKKHLTYGGEILELHLISQKPGKQEESGVKYLKC